MNDRQREEAIDGAIASGCLLVLSGFAVAIGFLLGLAFR
jgi:hypothetical protein